MTETGRLRLRFGTEPAISLLGLDLGALIIALARRMINPVLATVDVTLDRTTRIGRNPQPPLQVTTLTLMVATRAPGLHVGTAVGGGATVGTAVGSAVALGSAVAVDGSAVTVGSTVAVGGSIVAVAGSIVTVALGAMISGMRVGVGRGSGSGWRSGVASHELRIHTPGWPAAACPSLRGAHTLTPCCDS